MAAFQRLNIGLCRVASMVVDDILSFWRFFSEAVLTVIDWFHDHANATVACLALLVAIGTIIYQVIQGERASNPSEIDIWTANHDYRQHCQDLHNIGKHSKNCESALSKPLLPPPVAEHGRVSQDDELSPIDQHLAERAIDSTLNNANQSVHITARVEYQLGDMDSTSHDPMSYLPIMFITTILLYVGFYRCIRRRRSTKQWLFQRSPRFEDYGKPPMHTLTLQPLAVDVTNAPILERYHWVDYKSISESFGVTNQDLGQGARRPPVRQIVALRRRSRRRYPCPRKAHGSQAWPGDYGSLNDHKVEVS